MTELLDRLLARDASLWPDGNVSGTRLGWLDVPRRMRDESDDLRSWAEGVDAGKVFLLGMGGSSLGSEVLRASCGNDRVIRLWGPAGKELRKLAVSAAVKSVVFIDGGTLAWGDDQGTIHLMDVKTAGGTRRSPTPGRPSAPSPKSAGSGEPSPIRPTSAGATRCCPTSAWCPPP